MRVEERAVRSHPSPGDGALDEGRRAGARIAVTVARIRRARPRLTEAAMYAEVEAYMDWLQDRVGKAKGPSAELAFEKLGRELVPATEDADP